MLLRRSVKALWRITAKNIWYGLRSMRTLRCIPVSYTHLDVYKRQIKREMNNGKWTAIAIGYMCLVAYCASLVVYQIGGLITGEVDVYKRQVVNSYLVRKRIACMPGFL